MSAIRQVKEWATDQSDIDSDSLEKVSQTHSYWCRCYWGLCNDNMEENTDGNIEKEVNDTDDVKTGDLSVYRRQ